MEGPPFTGPRSKQLCEFIPYANEGSDEDARSPTSELYTGGWAWKQVKIGKDRTEYQYLVNVKASRPKTPDPGERIPRRHLKKLLKKWRLDLHEAAQAAQRMEESRSAISTTGSDSSYSRNGGNNWTTALPVSVPTAGTDQAGFTVGDSASYWNGSEDSLKNLKTEFEKACLLAARCQEEFESARDHVSLTKHRIFKWNQSEIARPPGLDLPATPQAHHKLGHWESIEWSFPLKCDPQTGCVSPFASDMLIPVDGCASENEMWDNVDTLHVDDVHDTRFLVDQEQIVQWNTAARLKDGKIGQITPDVSRPPLRCVANARFK
eukprot:GEMP01004821.1.p2 GENE.GEMP01004821.1~~GEMP01004821.1.p2  ORF type:complete len:321 (+),score=64.76 GEMP01004821.1:2780-3742(+)